MTAGKSAQRGNVPVELSEFVGRRAEVAAGKRVIGQSRLVTLAGPGGIGKTRLAMRVAAESRRAFADGVWIVHLAELRDAALLAREVARALELSDRSTQWAVETLSEMLSRKRALLILDTCEHLLNACAFLAEAILRSCPDVRILTTSREPLGVPGESVLQVPTMTLPPRDEAAGPEGLLRSEAARLFLSRARAVNPDFEATAANTEAIAEVVRRLEGIPLAIELAAIRMRSLAPAQLLDRLDDRFAVLSRGSRTADARQQTLHATLDWSYGLLAADERAMWRRAAVFVGSFGISAAEAICPDANLSRGDVFPLVDSLVAKSVIMREPGPGPARYRMLETVREFGRNTQAEGRTEGWLRRRHRDYYAALAARPEALGAGQVEWLDQLHTDHSNLRAALDFCLEVPGEAQSGLEIVNDLWLYWESRGHLTEGRRWSDMFLETCGDCATRSRGLWVSGYLALVQGDLRHAIRNLDESVRLGVARGEPTLAFALQFLGRARWLQGDVAAGRQLTDDGLRRHRSAANWKGIVLTLVQLGVMRTLQDDSAGAREAFDECIRICVEHGERWNLSYALWARGLANWRQGQLEEAARLETEALRLKRDVRDAIGFPMCLEALAWISVSMGEAERAALLLGGAAGQWRALPGELPAPLLTYRSRCLEELTGVLSAERFLALYETGQAATATEILGLALRRQMPDRGRVADPDVTTTVLTPRETEVAGLVALGLSNAEIGKRLVISARTAESHIQHIMNKLGVSSRREIAAWAAVADSPPESSPPAED